MADKDLYAETWQHMSDRTKSNATQDAWVGLMTFARKPYGKLNKRTINAVQNKQLLFGNPIGNYITIASEANFENHPNAYEVTTLELDKQDNWRVISYHLF